MPQSTGATIAPSCGEAATREYLRAQVAVLSKPCQELMPRCSSGDMPCAKINKLKQMNCGALWGISSLHQAFLLSFQGLKLH